MEELFGNHTEQEAIETEETPIEETAVQEETPAATQEDFFEVKYNKENLRISRDEAPTYIQKGLNYDKVSQKVSEYEQDLELIRELTGYSSLEELREYARQAQEQQRIQQESQRLGIDEDAYKQHFEPVNSELTQLRTQLQQLEQERQMQQIDREVNELRSKFDYFAQYEEKAFELAIERGYNLEDAYKLVSYEDRINNVARQKEQEVLAKVTGRDERQVLASNDQPANTQFDPSTMSLDEIQKLSERARRGERIVF